MGAKTEALKGRLKWALGHAGLGLGWTFLLMLFLDLPVFTAAVAGATVGWIVQEGIDTGAFAALLGGKWKGVSVDTVRDITNYYPVVGVVLLDQGNIVAGLLVIGGAAFAEAIMSWSYIRSADRTGITR